MNKQERARNSARRAQYAPKALKGMGERTFLNGCTAKIGYHSERIASEAIEDALYNRGVQLRTYKCHHCGLLHLTSQKPHR